MGPRKVRSARLMLTRTRTRSRRKRRRKRSRNRKLRSRKTRLTSSDNAVSCYRTGLSVQEVLHAKAIPWAQNGLCQGEAFPTTCYCKPTRRRTKPDSRVSVKRLLFRCERLTFCVAEAAIDANAPLFLDEDLDPSLNGPVDSDEERDAVMAAISRS